MTPKKLVVSLRQLLQTVEKFQFIMQKKNIRGSDANSEFTIFFKADALETGLKLFLCEMTLFIDEDQFTAEEILKTCPEGIFDFYRLKYKLITNCLISSDSEWIKSISDPEVPVLPNLEICSLRANALKCEALIKIENLEMAEDVLNLIDSESSEYLKLKGILLFLRNDVKSAQRFLLKSAKLNDSDWLSFFYLGKIYLSLRDESRGLKCLRRSCALKRTLDNVGLVCQYLSPQETLNLLVWLEIPFTQRKRFFYVFFLISNRSKTNTKKTLHSRIQNFFSFELPCRKWSWESIMRQFFLFKN